MSVKLNRRRTDIILVVILITILSVFIVCWEKQKLAQDRNNLQNNAKVIASALWNLDSSEPIAYIELAAKLQNLEHITIFTLFNEVFVDMNGPKSGFMDMALESIGLIPKIKLESKVIYQGEVIGRIEAIHRHTTIYLYFNIFLMMGLVLLATRLYLRVVEARNVLELRVEERTSDLISAKNDLGEEKERLTVTLRSIAEGVITTDINGNIVLLNKVAEELTGWSHEEAAGKPLSKVFHVINEESRKQCDNPVNKVLETGENITLTCHTALISRDGSECSITDSGAPIRNQRSEIIGVVLVFRDVTEELKREQELANVEKLKSVGLLAGGIAHDFNNILVAILGNINLALQHTTVDSEAHPLLQKAEKASLRASDLTQQLLTFAKGGEPIKELALIQEIIEESSSFVLRGSNVRCDYTWNADLWAVEIDQGQISQVIQNVVINADQAMAEGGIISVKGVNVSHNESLGLGLHPREYIKITIEDNGPGIERSQLDKIFDPYFTTKKTGSGLGLAISHSIIIKHEGYMIAESEPGTGTTFTIYLPAESIHVPHPVPSTPKKAFKEPDGHGHGRIMVMDDEEVVQSVSKSMLNHFGYDVVLANHGEEAIALFKEGITNSAPIDLIIMDLTIPGGMGGQEAVEKIHAIDPQVKVVVSSGYSNDPIMANCKAYGFLAAVTKPFQLQDLKSVVQRLL